MIPKFVFCQSVGVSIRKCLTRCRYRFRLREANETKHHLWSVFRVSWPEADRAGQAGQDSRPGWLFHVHFGFSLEYNVTTGLCQKYGCLCSRNLNHHKMLIIFDGRNDNEYRYACFFSQKSLACFVPTQGLNGYRHKKLLPIYRDSAYSTCSF